MDARRSLQDQVAVAAARHGSPAAYSLVGMEATTDHLMHTCCWRTAQALRERSSAAAVGLAGGIEVVQNMQQREGVLKLIRAGDMAEVCARWPSNPIDQPPGGTAPSPGDLSWMLRFPT